MGTISGSLHQWQRGWYQSASLVTLLKALSLLVSHVHPRSCQTTETPCVGQFRTVTTSGLSMRASAEHSSPKVEPSFWAQLDRRVWAGASPRPNRSSCSDSKPSTAPTSLQPRPSPSCRRRSTSSCLWGGRLMYSRLSCLLSLFVPTKTWKTLKLTIKGLLLRQR